MLLALQKHLYPEALIYLNHLIYQMDSDAHTEQVRVMRFFRIKKTNLL